MLLVLSRKLLLRHAAFVQQEMFLPHRLQMFNNYDFHLVWWDGVGKSMHTFPKLYRIWLAKHVSEFSGWNYQLSFWNSDHNPVRPSPRCGQYIETSMHITCYILSINKILNWMTETMADPLMVDMIQEYLLVQGSKKMVNCLHTPDADLGRIVKVQYELGWGSFVE